MLNHSACKAAHQLRSASASAFAHSGSFSGWAPLSPPRSSGDASTAAPVPPAARRGAGARFQEADFQVGVSAGLSSTSKRTLLRGRGAPATARHKRPSQLLSGGLRRGALLLVEAHSSARPRRARRCMLKSGNVLSLDTQKGLSNARLPLR